MSNMIAITPTVNRVTITVLSLPTSNWSAIWAAEPAT